MIAERKPAFSKALTPAMVVPPGLVTLSLSSAGWIFVSCNSVAVPNTVCTASC